MNDDAVSGALFLAADILVAAGTLVGGYFLLPSELQFNNLDYFNTSHTEIKAAWKGAVESATFMEALPTLGVMTGGVDEDQREAYGLAPGEGVMLRRVEPEGPSGRAGLRDGDVLIRIAGQSVGTSSLRSRLSQIGAGEEVQITIVREGERVDLPLMLGERPQ